MTELVIEIEGLRIVAARRTILSLDDLTVERSEVLGVLGPNGAGKTTLLKTCLGFGRPAAGRVTVLGQPVHRLRSGALCRLRGMIGYVPQMLGGGSELPLTLREVVAIGRTGVVALGRRLGRDDWRTVDEWLDRLGLASLARRRYGELSGGEQRKAMIAKAMVQNPRILLLDEPTANLDLAWRERIVETLEELYHRTRLTIVLVCHELEVLPACCRRVVMISDGRIVARGKPEDVLSNERVAELYGLDLGVLHSAGRHTVIPAGMDLEPHK